LTINTVRYVSFLTTKFEKQIKYLEEEKMKGLQLIITLLFVCSTSIVNSQQNNLVAHWSFDNVSDSTFKDETGNTTYGTFYGAKLIQGITGQALSFDGKDDYARIPRKGKKPPAILSNLGKGSISVWFKVKNIPTDYGIAPIFYYGTEKKCDFFDAANKGLIIELGHSPVYQGSQSIFFTIWKNGCTYPSFCFDSNEPISENEWHHFVAVVGEDYNTGYLDGKEMKNRRYNFGNDTYSQFFEDAVVHEKLWIGKGHWDRTTQYFEGAIDEIRIYNEPISGSKVESLYNKVPTKLSDNKDFLNIDVYPNPANKTLYYDIRGIDLKLQQIKIMSIDGKTIIQRKTRKDQQKLSLNDLPDGTYLIDFIGNNRTYRTKFMVSQ
jgi:hypothetical protein